MLPVCNQLWSYTWGRLFGVGAVALLCGSMVPNTAALVCAQGSREEPRALIYGLGNAEKAMPQLSCDVRGASRVTMQKALCLLFALLALCPLH